MQIYGKCKKCKKSLPLRTDGVLSRHSGTDPGTGKALAVTCSGTGQQPVQSAPVTLAVHSFQEPNEMAKAYLLCAQCGNPREMHNG